MTGIFKACFRSLMSLSRLVPHSKRRFILLLSFVVSLALLGFSMRSCINRARADTPTPTPTPVPGNIPPIVYLDSGINFTVGYGPSYVRYNDTYYNGQEIGSISMTGVQGYYNYIEISSWSVPYTVYPDWVASIEFVSDNVWFEVSSVSYQGVTYYNTFDILDGSASVHWERTSTGFRIYIQGYEVLGDEELSGLQNTLINGYLSFSGEWHTSAPDDLVIIYVGESYTVVPPVENPTPTPFPEPESPMSPDNSTTYNGVFSLLGNAIQWVGITIKDTIDNFIGDPALVTDEITSWNDPENESGPLFSVFEMQSDLLGFFESVSDWMSTVPTSARIDFEGYTLTIPAANGHPAVSGQIIPPIHRDIGADLESMGIASYLRIAIRFVALIAFLNYLYNLYTRVISAIAGDPTALAFGSRWLESGLAEQEAYIDNEFIDYDRRHGG